MKYNTHMLFEVKLYCKYQRNSDTPIITVIILTMWFYQMVMHWKAADGIANSVDPDQRKSLVWIYIVLPRPFVQILGITMLICKITCSGLLGGHVIATYLKRRKYAMEWYADELLSMAKELGNRLLPAFNTTTGIPYPRVSYNKYSSYPVPTPY